MHLDGCVEVDAAYYGAPPGWIGQRVQVQWNDLHVRLIAPKTGQLLREHLRAPRGWHRITTRTVPPGRRRRRWPCWGGRPRPAPISVPCVSTSRRRAARTACVRSSAFSPLHHEHVLKCGRGAGGPNSTPTCAPRSSRSRTAGVSVASQKWPVLNRRSMAGFEVSTEEWRGLNCRLMAGFELSTEELLCGGGYADSLSAPEPHI